jgi:hypothetical protein
MPPIDATDGTVAPMSGVNHRRRELRYAAARWRRRSAATSATSEAATSESSRRDRPHQLGGTPCRGQVPGRPGYARRPTRPKEPRRRRARSPLWDLPLPKVRPTWHRGVQHYGRRAAKPRGVHPLGIGTLHPRHYATGEGSRRRQAHKGAGGRDRSARQYLRFREQPPSPSKGSSSRLYSATFGEGELPEVAVALLLRYSLAPPNSPRLLSSSRCFARSAARLTEMVAKMTMSVTMTA